jgi:hypothetical protein
MSAGNASLLAGSFGTMNIFARSLGGIISDAAFAKFGFRGRLWAQFLALLFEGILFYIFGSMTTSQSWWELLLVLVSFSIFVQMAEGTSFGIVPFINKERLAVTSGIVGAGGSAGAAFASFAFYYRDWDDPRIPFKLHAEFVLFMAMLTPLYHWPEYGSMFSAPSIANSGSIRDEKSAQCRPPTMGSLALLHQQLQPDPLQREGDYLDMCLSSQQRQQNSRYIPAAFKAPSPVTPNEVGATSSSEESPTSSDNMMGKDHNGQDASVASETNSRQPVLRGSSSLPRA